MKRSLAFLLVLILVLGMIPGAAFAATDMPKLEISAADMLELTSAPDRYELMNAGTVYEASWIVPKFESYGLSAVIGRTMEIRAEVCTNSITTSGIVGVMIFKGTYDKITESSKPVETLAYNAVTGHGGYTKVMEWDTDGYSAGDYTGLLFLMNEKEEVVAASAVDLYLSKTEILCTGIDIYVYELNDTPDEIRLPQDGSFSFAVEYEPYHMTGDREWVFNAGQGLTYTVGYKADGASRYMVKDVEGETTLKLRYDGGDHAGEGSLIDSMKITICDDSSMPAFTGTTMNICGGQWYEIGITAPANAECWITNGNPYVLETKVENNKAYVRLLCLEEGELALTCGNYIDWLYVRGFNHNYKTEAQEPTCTENGYERNYCSICGDVRSETTKPALGHDIAERTVITEPKATKDGAAVGFCSRCNQDVELTLSRIFTDTQPDWFYSDALDYCYEEGIINGLSANTFGPTATLNRAQLVTMLYRHAGSPAVEGENTFADVPAGQFYTEAVAWASANGIVKGYEDNTFRPGDAITREQIVTMLHRYVVSLSKDNGERNDLSAFTDLDMLHEYAKDPMQWAVANGVINGLSETVLGPQEHANRAQTVTILYRIITGILEAE